MITMPLFRWLDVVGCVCACVLSRFCLADVPPRTKEPILVIESANPIFFFRTTEGRSLVPFAVPFSSSSESFPPVSSTGVASSRLTPADRAPFSSSANFSTSFRKSIAASSAKAAPKSWLSASAPGAGGGAIFFERACEHRRVRDPRELMLALSSSSESGSGSIGASFPASPEATSENSISAITPSPHLLARSLSHPLALIGWSRPSGPRLPAPQPHTIHSLPRADRVQIFWSKPRRSV
mmetsp:Transcript_29095/g.77998  ORF Transcript_29095/g.77998 Transcript_29095/m.77998 type:complete len:239 (-) Transcript_29095:150-866(-)